MKVTTKIVAALAVGIGVASAPIASASGAVPPWEPSIDQPVYRTTADVAGDAVIQIEAPGRSWGMRELAKSIDAQVDGLTIRTTGSCAANPTAVCVHVEIGSYSPEQQMAMSYGTRSAWGGLCVCHVNEQRNIYLNRVTTFPETRRQVAAHEFGHALGLAHHQSKGLTSDRRPSEVPSADELTLLVDWFSTQRYRPSA